MKLKILTFYFADNYGAVLQAYALQEKINNLGYDASISDYIPIKMKSSTRIRSVKDLIYINTRRKVRNGFINFRDRFFRISHEDFSSTNIYAVGSDQVWNFDLTGNDTTYFLPFNHNKKSFSYAASTGSSDFKEDEFEVVKKMLNSFDNISVREKSLSISLSKRLPNKNINYVLDPTLLHDSKFWTIIGEKPKLHKFIDRFVLVYMITYDQKVLDEAKKIAREKKMVVCFINNSIKKKFDDNVYNIRFVNPQNFIWLFNNASYVCTNSFHGTCFSLIFNKKLCVVPHKQRGARMIDLLNDLGMSEFLYSDSFDIDAEIDYNEINKKIELMRKKSTDFIIKSIERI